MLRMRAASRGRLRHRREDAKERGRLRGESSHHYGHRRRFPRAEHVKVSEFKNAGDPPLPNYKFMPCRRVSTTHAKRMLFMPSE